MPDSDSTITSFVPKPSKMYYERGTDEIVIVKSVKRDTVIAAVPGIGELRCGREHFTRNFSPEPTLS